MKLVSDTLTKETKKRKWKRKVATQKTGRGI